MQSLHNTNADFIGGAVRSINGKWSQNCYKTVYKNYSIHYFAGYERSENECLLCDMFLGPIFGKTEKLKEVNFDKKLTDNIISPDFFLKVLKEKNYQLYMIMVIHFNIKISDL